MTNSHEDYILSDTEARQIAAWWQDSRYSGLAALASSGAILDSVYGEISADIVIAPNRGEKDALQALGQYCDTHGPRGRVANWDRRCAWSGADDRALEARFGIVA